MSDSDDDEAFRMAREAAKRAKAGGAAPPPPPPGGAAAPLTGAAPATASTSAATAATAAAASSPAAAAAQSPAASPARAKSSLAQISAANVKRDASGRTVVQVTAYDDFSATRQYQGWVEKTAKYTKKWVKRWITLVDLTIAYSATEGGPPKHQMTLAKVTRGPEQGHEVQTLLIEATENGSPKPVELLLRTSTQREYELWFLRFSQALATYKLGDMPKDGAPLYHPKTGLPFIDIPVERLKAFGPVDRLALHFFATCKATFMLDGKEVTEKRCVFVGDLSLVICETDANVKRCVAIKDIQRIMTVAPMTAAQQAAAASPNGAAASAATGASPAGSPNSKLAPEELMHVGIQCNMPEFDILLAIPPEQGEDLVSVLAILHEHFGAPPGVKITPLRREKLSKLELMRPQLSLEANEFYELRVHLPMSKKLLAKMVQEGVKKGQLTLVKQVTTLGDVAMAPMVIVDGFNKNSTNATNGINGLSPAAGGNGSAPVAANDSSAAGGFASPPRGLESMMLSASNAAPSASPMTVNPLDRTVNPLGNSSPIRPPIGLMGGNDNNSSSGPVAPGIDKMHRLLNHIGLGQYYQQLVEKKIDWEVFCCMDALDLRTNGVTSVEHQIRIENALNDPAIMTALAAGGGGGGMPPPPPGFSSAGGGVPPPPPPPSNGGNAGSRPAVTNFIDDDDL